MNASRLLVSISTVGLVFACLTGQIHRQGILQGGILTILSGFGVMAAQRAILSAPAARTLGMIYFAVAGILLCALLLARQVEPAAANWLFAASAVVLAPPLLLVLRSSRSLG